MQVFFYIYIINHHPFHENSSRPWENIHHDEIFMINQEKILTENDFYHKNDPLTRHIRTK